MNWKTYILTFATKGARISFQLSLFLTFLYFFGLPAIEKYLRRDIMLVERSKFTDGIPVPAITIAVADQILFDYESCTNLEFSLIEGCIDANSKSWPEFLNSVVLGYRRKKFVNLTSDLVIEDFDLVYGKHFTLNMTLLKIGPDDLREQMYILLEPGYVYQIIIHDPDFFIFNENPDAIPMIIKYVDTRIVKSHFYRLALTEMTEVDHHHLHHHHHHRRQTATDRGGPAGDSELYKRTITDG